MNNILTSTLRAELARLFPGTTKYAVMALHVFLTKEKPETEPGFMEAGWINETLNHWRRVGFYSLVDGITEARLIHKFPTMTSVLVDIRAGRYDKAAPSPEVAVTTDQPEPIAPPSPITTQPINLSEEIAMECQRNENCGKPAGHKGLCRGQNNGNLLKPRKQPAPATKTDMVTKPRTEMVYTNPLLQRAPVSLAEACEVAQTVKLEIARQALSIASRALELLA